jgi:hypothetical protein
MARTDRAIARHPSRCFAVTTGISQPTYMSIGGNQAISFGSHPVMIAHLHGESRVPNHTMAWHSPACSNETALCCLLQGVGRGATDFGI